MGPTGELSAHIRLADWRLEHDGIALGSGSLHGDAREGRHLMLHLWDERLHSQNGRLHQADGDLSSHEIQQDCHLPN